jgi:hypothetical protein
MNTNLAYEPQTKFSVLFTDRNRKPVAGELVDGIREANARKDAMIAEATSKGAVRFTIAWCLCNFDQQTGQMNRITALRTYQDEQYG